MATCCRPDLHQRQRVADEEFARRRQRCAGPVTHEQLAAKLLLERLDPGTDRGLRDVQAVGGLHEAAARDDFEEGAGQVDVHWEALRRRHLMQYFCI
jgi:hypothetical protein